MKRKASILTLSLIILLMLAQGAFAQQVFLSFSTNGGGGIGVELTTTRNLSAVLSLQQRGFMGGFRHQLAASDVFVGAYLDSTQPKGGFAASIGTRIPERSGLLMTIEGGVRSRGDLFVFGTLGWHF